MGMQLTRGSILFTQDLDGVAVSTAWPTASDDGVAAVPASCTHGAVGDRVHVLLRMETTAADASVQAHLYGYEDSAAQWAYLASLNNGDSLVYNERSSPDANTIQVQESFVIGAGNMQRFKTRVVPGGTDPLVSTWVGVERG